MVNVCIHYDLRPYHVYPKVKRLLNYIGPVMKYFYSLCDVYVNIKKDQLSLVRK